jgi:hypothetical protein
MRWLLLLVLAGCDPVWTVKGDVTAAPGQPVGPAKLTIACPSGWTTHETSKADGSFQIGGVGFGLPLTCELAIVKLGYLSSVVPIRHACLSHFDSDKDKCAEAELHVRLAREPNTTPTIIEVQRPASN